jgi:hypothetical protein
MATENLPREPAIPSYFFGKGYTDLVKTIEASWYSNIASASEQFERGNSNDPIEGGFRSAAGISIYIFGTLFFLLFSVLHVALLFSFFLLVYMGFSVTFLLDWVYRTLHGFFTVCPDCHHKAPLPEYACPHCGKWHERLAPNKYGILRHTCLCGRKLPCVFFLGRSRLKCRCAACKNLLDAIHTDSKKAFVPVLGGVAVGKTVFLAKAIDAYRQSLLAVGVDVQFHESSEEAEFQDTLHRLREGQVPDKTISPLPRAKALELKSSGKRSRLLYLYDPAGEALQDSDLLAPHHYLEYLSGILLLVDPFVFDEFRKRFGSPESEDSNRALPNEVFQRILNNMHDSGLPIKGKIPVPVAVVLTKMDILPADFQQRTPATLLSAESSNYGEEVQAYSRRVRSLLEDAGLIWAINNLETHCAELAYFSCSALGRPAGQGNGAFHGWGCVEPLIWLLSKKNKDYLSTTMKGSDG